MLEALRPETLSRLHLPPPMARAAKRLAVHPRYHLQVRACRRGFEQFGNRYAQHVLFVAGLPKSGTTWLLKMIAGFPGFHELMIPDVSAYELATGGSHDYELPPDMFSRFSGLLVATRMHVHGSEHNVQVLHDAGVKCVVLYRDLRDVAVSYYFYVRQTSWHPEYPVYSGLSLHDGLERFALRTLPSYADWVRSWQTNGDAESCLRLRYEELLSDTRSIMQRVAHHFGLESAADLDSIVEGASFRRLSGGRKQGQESSSSFFRKGTAGDWENHFTPDLKEIYKKAIADFLIEYGYEEDALW